ncbi:MAG: hypothetical protein LBK05_06150 [Treponema sp.]|jgi:hypothetical protein|nr:hypothetical protein [Treponema sp.]
MNYTEFRQMMGITSPEKPKRRGRRPKEEPDEPSRDELIQAALERGLEETYLGSLSDGEIAALLEQPETAGVGLPEQNAGNDSEKKAGRKKREPLGVGG